MPSRQEVLLDTAIAIVGNQGIRQLTHRAVDAAARVPAGSTSNYFKTRQALLSAIVDHFAAREQTAWETIAELVQPGTPGELAAALAAYVRRATGPDRAVTIARYSLFIEAARQPQLQQRLAETARTVRERGAQWLRTLGSTDPEGQCQLILDQLDGIMLHQLAFPDPSFNPDRAITLLVGAIVTA